MAISEFLPNSPVPSDTDLYPDDLPFTAFGQFGEDQLDLRVFEQNIYWVNRFGEPFLLVEMTQEYLQNVLVYLYRSVGSLYLGVLNKTMIEIVFDSINGLPNGDLISHEMGTGITKQNPVEWLASTALMRKINSLIED